MKDITVVVVDDNKDIAGALRHIIDMSDGFACMGVFTNAGDAVMEIPNLKPDVVLMDINLGEGESGIDCVRKLGSKLPEIKFMMCTVYEDDEKIFEALDAGASGYVLKKTSPQKLLEALRELHEGGAPMSSQIARKIVNAYQHATSRKKKTSFEALIPKENEILGLLANGFTYEEIASSLYLTVPSVRKYIAKIYGKLHINNGIITKIKDKGFNINSLTKEQIGQLFRLSTSIFSYINHDLGNQRGTIFSALYLIKEMLGQKDESNWPEIEKFMQHAVRAAHNITSITDHIRLYDISSRAFDLATLFNTCPGKIVDMIRERNDKMKISVRDSDERLEIVYPNNILLAILSELAENARKVNHDELSLLIKWKIQEDKFHCEVHDDGIGISGVEPGNITRDIPYRTENSDNAGMGLKIIKKTIYDSGGDIRFSNSNILKGATISFEFPVIGYAYKTDQNDET